MGFAENTMRRRRDQIRVRTVQLMEACDVDCALDAFEMHDVTGDGVLDRDELRKFIKFLTSAEGMVVTDDDVSFILEEFDDDGVVPSRRMSLFGMCGGGDPTWIAR